MTRRLKRAAHRERAFRYIKMYLLSGFLLLLLLAPVWIVIAMWN